MADRIRLAGFAGLGFVVVLVLQFAAAPAPPGFDASGAEIRDYLVDNRSGVLAQGFLQVVAITLFAVFLVGLREVLRRADDEGFLATLAVIGGILMGVAVLIGQAAFNAPVWIDGNAQEISDELARLTWSLSYVAFGMSGAGLVLLAGCTAIAGFRHHLVPAAVQWVAAVAALSGFGGFALQLGSDMGGLGLAAFGAIVLFVLVTAIAMVARKMSAVAPS